MAEFKPTHAAIVRVKAVDPDLDTVALADQIQVALRKHFQETITGVVVDLTVGDCVQYPKEP